MKQQTLTPKDFGMVQATAVDLIPVGYCVFIRDGKIIWSGECKDRPLARDTKPDLVLLNPTDYKDLCAFQDKGLR